MAFDIDANGILSVHASDLATGKAQRIIITAAGGLKEDEIQSLVRDAQQHEADDRRRRSKRESHRIASVLYDQAKPAGSPAAANEGAPPAGAASKDGVIDAELEEPESRRGAA